MSAYRQIRNGQNPGVKMGEIFSQDGVEVRATLIPWDYNSSHLVYFVSGFDGDEYGQFPHHVKALDKAHFMVSIPKDKRREYDE